MLDLLSKPDDCLMDVVKSQLEENCGDTLVDRKKMAIPKWIEAKYGSKTPEQFSPFIWNDDRRAILRSELDALYAKIYNFSVGELIYILDKFPIVRRKDETKYSEYRSKRFVLEAYLRLFGDELTPSEIIALQQESAKSKRFSISQSKSSRIEPPTETTLTKAQTKPDKQANPVPPTIISTSADTIQQTTSSITLPPGITSSKVISHKSESKTGSNIAESKQPLVPLQSMDNLASTPQTIQSITKMPPGIASSKKITALNDEKPVPDQPSLLDFSLYKCAACGKMVMGMEKEKHTRSVHGGKDPGYTKIR
jgi:hypothetical protein